MVFEKAWRGSSSGLLQRLRRAFRAFEHHRVTHGDTTTASWRVEIVIEPDKLDGGWIVEAPDLPGCMAQGETEREALEAFKDVFVDYIALRFEMQLDSSQRDPRHSKTRHSHKVAVSI